MELTLKRKWFSDKSTIGELYIEDERECFTLEEPTVQKEIKSMARQQYRMGTTGWWLIGQIISRGLCLICLMFLASRA